MSDIPSWLALCALRPHILSPNTFQIPFRPIAIRIGTVTLHLPGNRCFAVALSQWPTFRARIRTPTMIVHKYCYIATNPSPTTALSSLLQQLTANYPFPKWPSRSRCAKPIAKTRTLLTSLPRRSNFGHTEMHNHTTAAATRDFIAQLCLTIGIVARALPDSVFSVMVRCLVYSACGVSCFTWAPRGKKRLAILHCDSVDFPEGGWTCNIICSRLSRRRFVWQSHFHFSKCRFARGRN